MYYIAKALQAAGLAIIIIDYLRKFPGLMSYSSLGFGLFMFTFGWLIQRCFLNK